MNRENRNRISYIVYLISEFADTYKIRHSEAYVYLKRFKGLAYINSVYDYLHTQPFADVVEMLTTICQRNGGELKPRI